MRRLFIIRKDLRLSPGKLAAQVGHCSEAYWTRWIQRNADLDGRVEGYIDEDIFNNYINGAFTKTICEARNKSHLLKAKEMGDEMSLIIDRDYGLIYDKCLTELEPEETDGTTLTGIWFRPLEDEVAHKISKKYQLYKDHASGSNEDDDTLNDEDEEERYVLSEWGCLFSILNDYGIDTSKISGRVGKHVVDDFMELMCKIGYIARNPSDSETDK